MSFFILFQTTIFFDKPFNILSETEGVAQKKTDSMYEVLLWNFQILGRIPVYCQNERTLPLPDFLSAPDIFETFALFASQ